MKKNALFCGLCTIDLQYIIEKYPTENSKIKTPEFNVFSGGPANNAARTFNYLGGKAHLITAFGQNNFSNFIENDFKNTDIKLTDFYKNQTRTPIVSSILTNKTNGTRTVFTNQPDENTAFDVNSSQSIKLTDYQLAMFDGFYPEFSLSLVKEAQALKLITVCDTGNWKPQLDYLLKNIDIAICPETFSPNAQNDVKQVFNFFEAKGVKYSAISRGEKSIIYKTPTSSGEIAVPKIKAADTLGAGDILHGAFCYFFLQNSDFIGALAKAAAIASHSCLTFGTRSFMLNKPPAN